MPRRKSSWLSLSAASWLAHKNMNGFNQRTIHPLSLSPIPGHPPCLPLFFWCPLRLSRRHNSLVRKHPHPPPLLVHSRPSLPRTSTGTTSFVSFSLSFLSGELTSLNSHIKLTLMTAFVGVNTVTIAAIRRQRTNSRSARPLSSTRSMVRSIVSPCFYPETAARAKTPHVP